MQTQQIGYLVDDKIVDFQSFDENNSNNSCIFNDNSQNALEIIRHSTAHLMAQAISELYTNAKFFVGPTIEDGFYYDFKVDEKISDEDLGKIEKKMKELCKKGFDIVKTSMSKEEILKKFSNDEIKQEVIKNIDSDVFSVYKQGDFEDLCRGPHVPNTKMLFNFKLTKVTGAYLGANEDNEMLTRIYGTAFSTKEALKEHLAMIEEAKKRDHRKLGTQLELFTFNDEVGAGLPLWLPNGARLRRTIENIIYDLHIQKGYEPVRGPEILKSDVWKQSGHYQNYGENIYKTIIDEQEYGIKPMNCLGHIKIFEQGVKSYRDLPVRLFEFGVVHRHEKSGVLHGLMRVREFTQDDSHIFCTQEQLKNVIVESLDLIDSIMKYFNFEYSMEISTKPQKHIGGEEIWDKATSALKEALNEQNLPFDIDEGGGAFYGPKIDIKITDALKRKWQCGTIQVDFNLPNAFNLSFVNAQNEKETPVMIHRAILGSFERFIGILTEHYAGEFPLGIAPISTIFIPISDEHIEYCKKIQNDMLKFGAYSKIYSQNESLSKRVRMAEKQKTPLVAIIGDNEVNENKISLRDRRNRTQYENTLEEFLNNIKRTINEKKALSKNNSTLLNDQILKVSNNVRCIGQDGEQFGVIPTKEALQKAYDLDIDAVMVSGGETPVVKLMDYNKYRYQAEKKKKEARKNQKKIEIKEIKLTPKIADNDIGYKIKHSIEFLEEGKHVRFKVFLRGREISSPKLAFDLLERIIVMVEEVGVIEQPPKAEGRHVTMYVVPDKKSKKEVKTDAKNENL